MTREEARQIIAIWLVSSKGAKGQRGYIEGWFDEEDVEAFRMAIEALQQEPSEDYISRERLRESLKKELVIVNNNEMYWQGWHDCTVAVETRITDAPSVVPKCGKWIDHTDEGYVECQFCHGATNCEGNIDELKFCFSCGVRME